MSDWPQTAMAVGPTCPICCGSEFEAIGTRPFARCIACGSVERSRLMFLHLSNHCSFERNARIMHLAPEGAIGSYLSRQVGRSNYEAFDIDPARYRTTEFSVRKLDLCADLMALQSDRYDYILHNHVLEHCHCSTDEIFGEFRRILKPSGRMVFSVPIRGEHTQEDVYFQESPEVRARKYGQADHVRIFGRSDLVRDFSAHFSASVSVQSLFTAEQLKSSGVPVLPEDLISGHSVLDLRS